MALDGSNEGQWHTQITGGDNKSPAEGLNDDSSTSLADREAGANRSDNRSQNNAPDVRQSRRRGIRGRGSLLKKKRTWLAGGSLVSAGAFTLVTLLSPLFSVITLTRNLFDDTNKYSSSAYGRRMQNALGTFVFTTEDGKFAGFSDSAYHTSIKDLRSEDLVKNLGQRGFSVEPADPDDPSKGFTVLSPDGVVDLKKRGVGLYDQFFDLVTQEYPHESFLTRARYAKSLYSRFRLSRTNVLDLKLAKFGDEVGEPFVEWKKRFRESTILDSDQGSPNIDTTRAQPELDENNNPIDLENDPANGSNIADDRIKEAVSADKVADARDQVLDSVDAPDFSFSAKNSLESIANGVARGAKAGIAGAAGAPSLLCQLKAYTAGFVGLVMLYRTINLMDAAVVTSTLGDVATTGQLGSATNVAMMMAFAAQLSKVNPTTGRNAFGSSAYQKSIGNSVRPHSANLMDFSIAGGFGGSIQDAINIADRAGLGTRTCSFATSFFGEFAALAVGLSLNVVLGAGGFFTGGVAWGALAANVASGVLLSIALDAAVQYGSAKLAPIVAGSDPTGDEYGDGIASYTHTGLAALNAFSGMAHGMSFLTNAQVAEWDSQIRSDRVIAQKKRSFFARVFDRHDSFITAAHSEMMGGVDLTDRSGTLARAPRYIASRILDKGNRSLAMLSGYASQTTLAANPDDIATTDFGAPIVGVSVSDLEAEEDPNSPFNPANALRDLVENGHTDAQLQPLSDEAKYIFDNCIENANPVLLYDEDGNFKDKCISGDSDLLKQINSARGAQTSLEEFTEHNNRDFGQNIISGASASISGPVNRDANSDNIPCPVGSTQVGDSAGTPSDTYVSVGSLRINLCDLGNNIIVNSSWAAYVQNMLRQADSDPSAPDLIAVSSFRDASRQIALRTQNCGPSQYDIYKRPSGQCSPPTAIPGRSNHERGLAIDFRLGNCAGRGASYNDCDSGRYGRDDVFEWLKANGGPQMIPLNSEAWHWSATGG